MTPRKPITSPPNAAALLRYVSGESTLAEADWIGRWAAADPDREASIMELRTAWEHGARRAPVWDGSALWSRIEAEVSTAGDAAPETSAHRLRGGVPLAHGPLHREGSTMRRLAYAVAASLVLAAVGATALHVRGRGSRAVASTPSVREVTTARGEMATLSLADGSTVTLAPGSTLRVPTTFEAGPREATLDGEAVFAVKHDASHPFRVRTRAGITQDVGTRFVICAYAGDPVEVVAVAAGAVSIRRRPVGAVPDTASSPAITLRAGDVAALSSSGALDVRRGIAVANYFGWTARRLVFTGTPMPDVARVLGRWYDLDLRIDDAVATRTLTADFSIESVPEMLHLLEVALDARVVQHGRTVTLHAR